MSLTQRKVPIRVPTVRPVTKPGSMKEREKAMNSYVKPIVTTMGRMFPSVDKLCDAAFMKKIFGLTTKKNGLLFIAETPTVYGFFNQMEQKMKENNVLIRKEIEHFVSTKEVLMAISAFKIQIKQIEAEQKIMKKEQERQAIIEQERDRIIMEEKNRIIAQHHEELAHQAKMKGDDKAAQEHSMIALKLMEKQKEQERCLEIATTESSDSSHERESDEDNELEDEDAEAEEEASEVFSKGSRGESSTSRSSTAIPTSQSRGGTKEKEKEKEKQKEKEIDTSTSHNQDDQLDINRVKEIIQATNDADFLLVKHGNKEFKITSLTLDRVNAKLVLNVEPVQPIQPEKSVKVSFD